MRPTTGRRIAVRILRFLALLYLAMIISAFLGQRRLLYHPDSLPLAEGTRLAASAGFQPWLNSSNQYIGWKKISAVPAPHSRILVVHGNAGSAIHRLTYADDLAKIVPLDVYILEYPGYGPRPGSPTQTSLFQAGTEVLELLKRDGPVYLMGESLGTGVAAYLAGTFPGVVQGVLLIAPYNRMTDVAQYHMPYLPVKWLLLDKYPSTTYLQNYHGPVAVLLAGSDEVIPNKFGKKLLDDYRGPKISWEIPGAGHNDLLEQPASLWNELIKFWRDNQSPNAPQSGFGKVVKNDQAR